MRRMPVTDAFFLIMESRRTPMHVGGLNLFTCLLYTSDAADDWLVGVLGGGGGGG